MTARPLYAVPAPWHTRAACQAADPDLMFPENDRAVIAKARAVCGRCPVVADCLADALEAEAGVEAKYRWGIYGGLRPGQRWRLAERGVTPGMVRAAGERYAAEQLAARERQAAA